MGRRCGQSSGVIRLARWGRWGRLSRRNFRDFLVIFGRYPVCLKSSLHPNRTRGILWDGCLDYPAPLPHHRGTPARRAVRPGMPIPRLDPEAGLARGCGERAHQESSSKHQRSSSARRTASPPPGVFFRGRGSPDCLLAAGARRTSARRDPLICPTSPPHALT